MPVLRKKAEYEAEQARGAGVTDPDPNPLPPDYDGWLQYTAFEDSGGFDSMVATMSVPDIPKSKPQILYIFPGLQNIDWIPKVDPEPTSANPFDIIQPVLQYPASGFHKGWSVKSWYVTVNAGALFSKEIDVKTGDAIVGVMNRTGPDSYVVSSKLASDGTATVQSATNNRLKIQPWAYNTIECYGTPRACAHAAFRWPCPIYLWITNHLSRFDVPSAVCRLPSAVCRLPSAVCRLPSCAGCSGCKTYPLQPCLFTDIKLTKTGGAVSNATWLVNPKPAAKLECNEATTVLGPDAVTFSFQ